jgi:hypothetical protein
MKMRKSMAGRWIDDLSSRREHPRPLPFESQFEDRPAPIVAGLYAACGRGEARHRNGCEAIPQYASLVEYSQ